MRCARRANGSRRVKTDIASEIAPNGSIKKKIQRQLRLYVLDDYESLAEGSNVTAWVAPVRELCRAAIRLALQRDPYTDPSSREIRQLLLARSVLLQRP